MPPVSGGFEIVILPAGDPDPLDVLRESPVVRVDNDDVSVTIRPSQVPANDDLTK